MPFAHVGKVGKLVASFGVVAGVVIASASCDDYEDHFHYYRDCDYVDTRCRNVCDYYCDFYSCYPTCWNQCWDVCLDNSSAKKSGTSSSSSGGATDAGAPAKKPDGSTAPADSGASKGTGVLCTSCISNSDCESGALCILRGGPPRDAGGDAGAPAGRGFCGATCTTSADCPDGFLCSQLGSSRQCLPTGNACE